MGRAAFDDDSGGCEPLLSNWGGEGIYWALADEPGAPSPGIPTIVVTQIQVNVPLDTLHVFPGALPNSWSGSYSGRTANTPT